MFGCGTRNLASGLLALSLRVSPLSLLGRLRGIALRRIPRTPRPATLVSSHSSSVTAENFARTFRRASARHSLASAKLESMCAQPSPDLLDMCAGYATWAKIIAGEIDGAPPPKWSKAERRWGPRLQCDLNHEAVSRNRSRSTPMMRRFGSTSIL